MKFEVYCDEAMPDLFTSQKPGGRYLMIGSLWLPTELRTEVKRKVREIREKHNTWGEIKWSKVAPSRVHFYLDLVDLFESYGLDMRFRCIAVDHTQVNMELHDNDKELGFYKFYYQMLHNWILDFNEYHIYCDAKTNRDPRRMKVLRRCLYYSNLSSEIKTVQSLPSGQVVMIQLCDLLLGAASSRLNNTLRRGTAKESLVLRLESHLGREMLRPTSRTENKYNIFRILLNGGW